MALGTESSALRGAMRIVFGGLLLTALIFFILWRTENPRLQQLRITMIDAVAPLLEGVAGPADALGGVFLEVESYADLQAENDRLRRQLARLRTWRDIAQRLEEENARLRALNAVKPPPRISFVTAEIIGDSGGPFAQSAIVNVGARDGVEDGAPALDAAGLAGRVVGVGDVAARLLLLTDPSSRTPVMVGPDRWPALLVGDNTRRPKLIHQAPDAEINAGDLVITSGQGGVYPLGLAVGRVVPDDGEELAVQLAANYQRLEFVRIYRRPDAPASTGPGGLIFDAPPAAGPAADAPAGPAAAAAAETANGG